MSIENILITIFISCLSAWVTMRLALHRFYREKWWDKRATAYLELLDTLYDFKEDYGAMETSEQAKSYCNNDGTPIYPEDIISDENESDLWKRMSITHDKLKKIKGLGPLVFTEDVLEKIAVFIARDNEVRRRAIGDEIDNMDAYGEMWKSADDLYNEFKSIATIELKLKSRFVNKLEKITQWIFTQYIRAEDEYRKSLQ